jgi:excisionase family DNA binding protein
MTNAAEKPQQLDFQRLLFPGRTVLYVSEVAEKLNVSERHIVDLIEEGKLLAINIGGHTRKFWRIPVDAYEKFIQENRNA